MKTPRLLDGRLKLRHLVLLDALLRQGSVVGAAVQLHVTQPVATRGLHELEEILGVTLFDRGPRGITPTVYGAAFAEHARAVLAQLTEAGRHIVELADAVRGTVVVGIHLAGSNMLLPRAITKIKADHPYLTVVVREAAPEPLLVELVAGRVDMIVGRLTAPSDEQIERRKLYDEFVDLIVRPTHPLAGRTGIAPAELGEYPWILPGQETVLRRELEEFFARNGIPLPANRVEATSFLTVRELLLANDVIAALPSLIARGEPKFARLDVSLDQIGHSVGLTLPTITLSAPTVSTRRRSARSSNTTESTANRPM
ncbi:LysR substrate-binding domain-containing protein [Kibdelosporangium philippinense]|uniref:LysR substrate-binding domain-containing protein n=1 Tax=Kibdelosporangium philippinense TaxID=211113 RepID=A0ABS8Z7L0_9PSEU|nr:LysR substrate-binding domain-containing protein [Kibdelosporangium philippinense]MCE7003874.1 LysR substrate-binding domain-containing protein [Kibdelosporangium philippinense]